MPANHIQSKPKPRLGEIPYRKVFGISRFECDELIDNSGVPADLNGVWQRIADRYGFVWTTVREVAGGDVALDDPWLVTAEVEDVTERPVLGPPEKPTWLDRLNRPRVSIVDGIAISLSIALCLVGQWAFGLGIAIIWMTACAITEAKDMRNGG